MRWIAALVAALVLIAATEGTAGSSDVPRYSGFLGRVLHEAGVEDDVTYVHQLEIDEIESEGETHPIVAWRIDTSSGSLLAFVIPVDGETLAGVITGLDGTDNGTLGAPDPRLSSWLFAGMEPDAPIKQSVTDIPLSMASQAGIGCELATNLIGDGVATKVPACSATWQGFLACSAGSFVISHVACNNSPGSWLDGATCTSRGVRWWTTYADPSGTSFCAYEDRASSSFFMVRAFELIPTNCKQPASGDCYGLNSANQLVPKNTYWRLTTHWPDGLVVQGETYGTAFNAPKGIVTTRSGNLPRGTYRMVIRAEETIDIVGWSETGKIQSVWSIR